MKSAKLIFGFGAVFLVFGGLLSGPSFAGAQSTIDPNFNPNLILNDADIRAYDSMSLPDIQNFLQQKGSYLAYYYAPDANGITRTAAEIIYNATHNNYNCDGVTLSDQPTEAERQAKCLHITTVSPKLILVLLQKEASLIEDGTPTQSRLDWATGYGCPDNWVCNPYYKGFGKQINSAALQFLAYMNEQSNYNYRAGQTYVVTNTLEPYCTAATQRMAITPQNKATAALYNYTPHVFNGNYNLYLLWQRYFGGLSGTSNVVKLYADGSLLQIQGEPGVWLIANGQKRPFLNYSAFISRFKPEQILLTSQSELDKYPLGEAIKFANYSLAQTPDKQVYLLVNNEKRPFASASVLKSIGFNPEEIEAATVGDLSTYVLGKAITATSTNVTGALMQDTKTGGVFFVENGTKAPLLDKILLTTKFKNKKIMPVSPSILNTFTTVAPVLLPDGSLLKSASFPTVYLISNGQKRPFASEAAFGQLGYKMSNTITVSSQLLYQYPLGETIQ